MNPASLINLQPGHAHMMAVCDQYGVTRDELRAAYVSGWQRRQA